MRAIGFSEHQIAAIQKISVSEEEAEALPKAPFLDAPYTGSQPEKVLALFVHYLASYSELAYSVCGLSREEWLGTMRDLVIWSNYLFAERGELGIRETHWLAHLVRTEIFRLGRLQFVPRLAEEQVIFNGRTFPIGTPYCEVHIPADGKLLPADVDASFARAKKLLAPQFYSCESWLLSPKLKTYLSGGNILAFASRFTVVEFDEGDRSAERYIFGRIGAPQDYIAQNSFSARVKEAAISGNYVGSATGYRLSDLIFPKKIL